MRVFTLKAAIRTLSLVFYLPLSNLLADEASTEDPIFRPEGQIPKIGIWAKLFATPKPDTLLPPQRLSQPNLNS
jgi:hypothetical protein